MSIIKVNNLTFSYDGSYDTIFDDVSFTIDTNWKLGFIGRNGRGKTTFLNLLLGKHKYSGSIQTDVEFSYFPFAVEDRSQLTIYIAEAINPDCPEWKLMRELNLLGVDLDALYRPFDTLSNGERTKVLLAALFTRENNFLLIDEPTDHLDLEARAKVSEYLNSKSGFILVSHDRTFLDNCVDHVLSVNKTTIEVQKGNFSTWKENRDRQDAFELGQNEKLKKDIAHLTEAAAQMSNWSDKVEASKSTGKRGDGEKPGFVDRGYIGAKSAKMMRHAKSAEKRSTRAIEQKEALLKDLEYYSPLKTEAETYFAETLLYAKELSIIYGEKNVFDCVSFAVKRGERVALCGKNGCGKSSVLKLVLGQDINYKGELNIGSRLKISYVPQDASQLTGELRDFVRERGVDEALFKTILRKLGFAREQFDKRIENYSEGQKKKVLIAGSLCQSAHLYIWDEPLNFMDVMSRMQVEEVILKSGLTMLFVEHDSAFIDNVATSVVRFTE